ncbi:hypothetical protein SC125_14900, partial [Legionella pneumophila serogroup 1]
DFSLPSLKIERSVYTLNPFQKITILIRFQSISRAFDNFHSLFRQRHLVPWASMGFMESVNRSSRHCKHQCNGTAKILPYY